MTPQETQQDRELIDHVAAILDDLGPFAPNARRSTKWRTTEQLANDLADRLPGVALEQLDDALTRYEHAVRDRLSRGEPPNARIRRATYPDRTTALPLWGSTREHGQPWPSQAPATRIDAPTDLPPDLRLPESAPCVFLSHTRHDSELTLRIAAELARSGFRSWLFEAHIAQRGPIAACVREAIASVRHCLAIVTRDSIASLWVLTELHTAIKAGRTVRLVVDTSDATLMELLASVRFRRDSQSYPVLLYDETVVERLREDYEQRHSHSRVGRYANQVRDFLATIPDYLAGRSAFAYPEVPAKWNGAVGLTKFRPTDLASE